MKMLKSLIEFDNSEKMFNDFSYLLNIVDNQSDEVCSWLHNVLFILYTNLKIEDNAKNKVSQIRCILEAVYDVLNSFFLYHDEFKIVYVVNLDHGRVQQLFNCLSVIYNFCYRHNPNSSLVPGAELCDSFMQLVKGRFWSNLLMLYLADGVCIQD